MSKIAVAVSICASLLTMTGAAFAADVPVFSGPQTGEKLASLKVELAYGPNKGDQVDLVAAADGKPRLFVFVHGANRPAARLSRVLLNYSEMRAGDGLSAALVWLDNDRTAARQYLRRAISWWGIGPPVGVSVDGAEGPGSYGLNRNVNVTVLVANKNLVTSNFALVQPSETDSPMILKEVVKLIGGDEPTKAEVLFLSAPTRKPADAKWHTAPQDVRFRRLICDLLASKDETAAKTAAQAIEEFVRGDTDRNSQLRRVADMLGKGRTNVGAIPAANYLRLWREQFEQRRIE